MKLCRKCEKEYKDDYIYCPKCGTPYDEKMKPVRTPGDVGGIVSKVWNGFLYVFVAIIILGSLSDLTKFYGLIGVLFGLSMLPIVHDKVFSIKKIKDSSFIKKFKKAIKITVPIALGLLWGICLPGEQLETITINDEGHIIAITENYEIDFDTNLTETNKEDFEYISSNPEIATVDKGIINGKNEGNVIITIKGSNSIEEKAEYKIKYVDIEELKINGNTKLLVGKSDKLTINTNPKIVSDKISKWESSNNEVISVDKDGNITANNKGTATITVTTEKGKTSSIDIGAYIEVTSMTMSETSVRVEKGKNITLSLNILPENADINGIAWSSDNNSIAKVENGIVTGIKEGKTIITATSVNGVKTTATVEVYEVKPESVSLNKTSLSLNVGQTETITANVNPSNASDKSVSWSSSSYSVASVENGVITAKNIGTATITARTSNGKTATVEVTVTKKAPIKINNFRYTKDYVCGVEWNFSITNNSGKTINYITLKWYNFNAVGDFVYDQIDGKNYTQLRYTGPLRAGANSGSKRNTTKFYNCNYNSSSISDVKIEYEDGTTETISSSDMKYYTNLY